MEIIRSGECKNSPKNAFVEDIVIDLLASRSLTGRVEDTASLPKVPDRLSKIEVYHAISHGKVGAANGLLTFEGSETPFAVFLEFASTKASVVRSLKLYLKYKSEG